MFSSFRSRLIGIDNIIGKGTPPTRLCSSSCCWNVSSRCCCGTMGLTAVWRDYYIAFARTGITVGLRGRGDWGNDFDCSDLAILKITVLGSSLFAAKRSLRLEGEDPIVDNLQDVGWWKSSFT